MIYDHNHTKLAELEFNLNTLTSSPLKSFSSITEKLDKMNSPTMSYHATIFSDSSGRVEDEQNQTVFNFDDETEFNKLINAWTTFEKVRNIWKSEGLTDEDLLNFMGKSID